MQTCAEKHDAIIVTNMVRTADTLRFALASAWTVCHDGQLHHMHEDEHVVAAG
ncbi:hypothetical protein ACVW1C_007394 [Bradyrhizobium sp. USDA 4011]